MKNRLDFVSNSSSCCYVLPIDFENHDKSKWLKNTLRIQPDNKKLMMEFDDFSNSDTIQNDLHQNWKFICTQVLHWVLPNLACEGVSKETKKKILRKMYNSEEFQRLETAVKEMIPECEGVEFDEEDIRETVDSEGYGSCTFIPDCEIDHDSIFDGFDDLLEQSKCSSIAELIWGIKEIRITY